MKRIATVFLLIFLSFSIYGQPWLRYLSSTKSGNNVDKYLSLKKAFKTYWNDREPVHGDGYKPFARWEWMVDQRITSTDYIKSQTLWNEILKKEEARKNADALGDWHFIGPENPPTDINTGQIIGAGRIDCIAFHPSDTNTFWIGAPTGGLWKTTDGGKTWTPLTDFLASIGISDIAVDPRHPDTLFIATGDRDAGEIYSAGVLKTYDGGRTWMTTGLNFTQAGSYNVNRLLMRPDKPDTMIAATNNGIYFITDQGMHTSLVKTGNFKDMAFMPGNPDIIYAASYFSHSHGDDTASIYRSDDGGLSFHEISEGIKASNIVRIKLAVTPARPSLVLALCADKANGKLYAIYRSMDKGDHWTRLLAGSTKNLLGNAADGSGTDGQGWYDLALAMPPGNYSEIYVGGINIWKTNDGGGSWHLTTWGYPENNNADAPYIHVDQHILAFQPGTHALYAGNDGGLFRSNDKGNTWTNLSDGLEILQIYRIGSSATKRNLVLMGSQDNSSIMWRDTSWNVLIGGDGMECMVDYADTNTLYASSQYGNIARSTNGGQSFKSIKPANAGKGAWVTPYLMFPDDHKSLLAGYAEIYKSNNQGSDWTPLTDKLSINKTFTVLAISSFNPDYIYASTGSNLWRSSDGGQNWANIRNGLPDGTITGLAIARYDPQKIWVTLSNYLKSQKVYVSGDGGNLWHNYSEGLPNIPVNCIVYQNNSNSALYVGTDMGVYFRDKNMSVWKDFGKNLPNVIVNELGIYYPDSLLRAGTYGRGLWESKLYYPRTPSLYAEFSSDKAKSCVQGNFTFYNRYPGKLDSLLWSFGPDGNPPVVKNQDTVQVTFPTKGAKDVSLIVYLNGLSDSLFRTSYVYADTSINIQISTNYINYYWRGHDAVLTAKGADTYTWISTPGQDTLYGKQLSVMPDSDIVYNVYARQGVCRDTDSISIKVWPNDLIKYALPLEYGENGPFINYEASVENNEPQPPAGDCNTDSTWCDEFSTGKDYLAHSVWFVFTGPADGIVSLDTKGFDDQIAVYSSPSADSLLAGNYKLLYANDDYHGADSSYAAAAKELTGLSEGDTYWVQIDGSGGNKEGTFYIYLYGSPLDVPMFVQSEKEKTFVVYPNPNAGAFTLLFKKNMQENSLLKIFSTDGKKVYQRLLPQITAGETISLSLSIRQKGLFFIQITTPDHIYTGRMIVW